MYLIEAVTIERDGGSFRIRIYADEDAPNPLTDWSGMGVILSLNHRHRNYDPTGIERAMAGNPDAVPLSYYEHGLCLWSVAGELPLGADCPWDSVTLAGLWLPDANTLEDASGYGSVTRRQFMRSRAREACEAYTAWCNGEVYRFEIARITSCPCCGNEQDETVDSRSGFYGLETCRAEADSALERLTDRAA